MNRRIFLRQIPAFCSSALYGISDKSSAEAPPEVTRVTFVRSPALCIAPQYIAEAMLKAEGFTEIRYERDTTRSATENVSAGTGDFGLDFAGFVMSRIDAGDPLLMLAGIHAGCYTLFGGRGVNSVRDLKGKKVAILYLGGSHHLFLSMMAAYVGLGADEIRWVPFSPGDAINAFSDGHVDAILAFEPEQQELFARGVGHVVIDTATDKPWSQYYCCVLTGHRDFVRKYPVATKRLMRGLLKTVDICAKEPTLVARDLVDIGYAKRFDYAARTLQLLPYDRWRQYDPEDTLRFYGLRLHDVRMIKSTPEKIIAQGTDWRFLNDLKKEMKA